MEEKSLFEIAEKGLEPFAKLKYLEAVKNSRKNLKPMDLKTNDPEKLEKTEFDAKEVLARRKKMGI